MGILMSKKMNKITNKKAMNSKCNQRKKDKNNKKLKKLNK